MTGMRRIGAVLSVLSVGVVVAGCATSTLRNSDNAVRVSRADLDAARTESWWGKPLTVDQAQILER